MERNVKKLFFGLMMLTLGALTLHAIEIPVSITMNESLPYQKELHYDVVKAISGLENVKIVEPGDKDWFRLYVLSYEIKLENQESVGYAISYSVVEVPFYLHAYIFENLGQENRKEGMDRLIPRTVFYHGSDLMTVGTDGLEPAAERIRASLKKFLDMRIQSEQ
jgi:hypothetical protein